MASQVNLNDGTVEAFSVAGRPILSAQYHPEAAPALKRLAQRHDVCVIQPRDPAEDGALVTQLTEERRREYVKVAKSMAEDGRIALRNVRRDARKSMEAAEKDPERSTHLHAPTRR